MTDQEDILVHFGVKGMRWGVRKSSTPGVSRKTDREAAKDATEFTKAKMFYGESAGTRRKLIKAKVEAKAKKDPNYKKAFDAHVERTDMGKRAEQARSQRARKDVSNSARKTARGVGHVIRGNSQYASLAAVALVGAGTYAYKNGGDQLLRQYGGKVVSTIQNEIKIQRARAMLRDMGI